MKFKHSPKRDEEVFKLIKEIYGPESANEGSLVFELMAIAKKWRSKAVMREERIKESADKGIRESE